MSNYMETYKQWCTDPYFDADTKAELKKIEGDQAEIEDRFYRQLEFGTGGLRGVIGAGTNRMNIYTVRQATQGLANYIISQNGQEKGVAIAHDSRIMSPEFTEEAALCLNANGIKAYVFDSLRPTPELSFAVRELGCISGIVITASHNPREYNGYKVYWEDGAQITPPHDKNILAEVAKVTSFDQVKTMAKEEAVAAGLYNVIGKEIDDRYMEELKKQSIHPEIIKEMAKDIKIVYTPFHGTGNVPVRRILKELGFKHVYIVKEQEKPDGRFPTCPYPNPEIREAMSLGMEYAKKVHADLLLATDPDCDRVGIAVVNPKGEYQLLSGNETGLLLLDYICSQKMIHAAMPEHPVLVKTIVTTDLAEKIADKYGVQTVNVLTGFKFIGEQIGLLEKEGRKSDYIFGFEESYGYLSGTYVRDKDGVNASVLICEMFAFYKTKGVNLLDKLKELYAEHGYCMNQLHTYKFQGEEGMHRMENIMEQLRNGAFSLKTGTIKEVLDYKTGIGNLPKSNVIKMVLENGSTLVVRPSGTEPKLKIYTSILGSDQESVKQVDEEIVRSIEKLFER